MKPLRELVNSDRDALLQVYREAVQSCPDELYSIEQRLAWAAQAGSDAGGVNEALKVSLQRGRGLISSDSDGRIAAFILREPADRLALLYCRPQYQRQGHASQLLQAMEADARRDGIHQLRTEASFVSCPLLERHGWRRSWQEELLINGVLFRRFRLHKPLAPILD